jgi:peptidoglycan/xylan/chitin deacetylase (PgdA/CDA1 family)
MPSLAQSIRRAPPLLKASLGVHGAALAALIAAPQASTLVAATLVANHLVIGTAGLFPRCAWLGPNLRRLPPHATGILSLTFDDGPDPAVTPRVLSLLEAAGQRATFFCVGARAAAYPDITAEIARRGHGVENHSYSHPNGFALRGPRGLALEIDRAQEAIGVAAGKAPTLFRAPAGIQNPWLDGVLASAGLSLVSWTRRGFDTVSRSGSRVAARLIGPGLAAGDILVLHDRTPARDMAGRPVVLEALPRLLDAMAAAGLRSEPVHTVLQTAGAGAITAS